MVSAKPIPGFENYLVDECGRIYSKDHGIYRKFSVSQQGYCSVDLYNRGKTKRFLVHRLVATAFIPNPNNLPQVNHKDENPLNNNVNNLEWCSAKYNMNYGNGAKTRHLKIDYSRPIYKEIALKNSLKRARPIIQFDRQGNVINKYESAAEAGRITGINKAHINSCCNNKQYRHTAGGYVWKFERR